MGLLESEDKGRLLYVLADGLLRERYEVVNYSSFSSLPQQGEDRKLYIVPDERTLTDETKEFTQSIIYHWDGFEYKEGGGPATLRVVKDNDGTIKAEKWEVTYPGIKGFITGVAIFDGDYGTNILISIKDTNEEEFTLSLNAKSKYGEDFLHKLPNVAFDKETTIKPYNFETDGKNITGVSMTQGDTKLTNAYNYKNADGEWESVDGYPQVDEKKKPKNSDQWMIFFTQRREWVIKNLIERGLITTTGAKAQEDF